MSGQVINNAHVMGLIVDRAQHAKTREEADAKVKVLNEQIKACLEGAGVKRHQLPDGTIVQIIFPKDRSSIVPERLLGHGVSPKIIEDSTKHSPVAPFIRIDAPGSEGAKIDAAGGDRHAAAPAGSSAPEPGSDPQNITH